MKGHGLMKYINFAVKDIKKLYPAIFLLNLLKYIPSLTGSTSNNTLKIMIAVLNLLTCVRIPLISAVIFYFSLTSGTNIFKAIKSNKRGILRSFVYVIAVTAVYTMFFVIFAACYCKGFGVKANRSIGFILMTHALAILMTVFEPSEYMLVLADSSSPVRDSLKAVKKLGLPWLAAQIIFALPAVITTLMRSSAVTTVHSILYIFYSPFVYNFFYNFYLSAFDAHAVRKCRKRRSFREYIGFAFKDIIKIYPITILLLLPTALLLKDEAYDRFGNLLFFEGASIYKLLLIPIITAILFNYSTKSSLNIIEAIKDNKKAILKSYPYFILIALAEIAAHQRLHFELAEYIRDWINRRPIPLIISCALLIPCAVIKALPVSGMAADSASPIKNAWKTVKKAGFPWLICELFFLGNLLFDFGYLWRTGHAENIILSNIIYPIVINLRFNLYMSVINTDFKKSYKNNLSIFLKRR